MNEGTAINESAPSPALPEFKDRRNGLLIFGILEILMGALCVLVVGLILVGQMLMSRTTETTFNARMVLPAVLVYLLLAVAFIWLGIGSIKCRRWARSLLLILSWSWLGTGLISVPLMSFLLPRILAAAPANGQALPAGAMLVVMVIQLVVMSVILVVVPGVQVFFYSSRHVRATCEARNAGPCWTDTCPLPVLAVACWLWLGAAMMLCFPVAYNGVMPVFGTLVSGLPGGLIAISFAGWWFWLGRMWYQRRVAGWRMLTATMLALGISSLITFSRLDMVEMYQKMGYPEAQIEMIRRQGLISSQFMLWISTAWLTPILGYLLWVKHFFSPDQKAS